MSLDQIEQILDIIKYSSVFAWNTALSLWAVIGIDLFALVLSVALASTFIAIFYRANSGWFRIGGNH